MSLINRIHVSNFLNIDQVSPWKGDWRNVLFDLRGQNTAAQLTNGAGKTTLTDAILTILSRDRDLAKKVRQKMPPASYGQPAHIRVEFISKENPQETDMLAMVGGDVPGETFVFGMYGFSGEGQSLNFYHYKGRLEDVPTVSIEDDMLRLLGIDKVRQSLKQARATTQIDVSEWISEIDKHMDRGNVSQLLQYHKLGGGDSNKAIFEIKQRSNERYDETFFYEMLAPELLSNAMNSEAREGENSFEDTILISAQILHDAKFKYEQKDIQLNNIKEALSSLELVKFAADDHKQARERRNNLRQQLSQETSVLHKAVVTDPIPGIPLSPSKGAGPDERTRSIIDMLVLKDGEWLLPDYAICQITNEDVGNVNRRAKRLNDAPNRPKITSTPFKLSQVIENPWHFSNQIQRKQGGSGKENKGYDLAHIIHDQRQI